jgi:hypothetical protein
MGKYCVSTYLHSQFSQRCLRTFLQLSCCKVHWFAHRCAMVASSSSHVYKEKYVYLSLLLSGTHCNWNTVWFSIFIIIIIIVIIFTIFYHIPKSFVILQNSCNIFNITCSTSHEPVLHCCSEFYIYRYRITQPLTEMSTKNISCK